MSKLPKKLKIGAFKCVVREVEGLVEDGTLNRNIILIESTQPEKDKWLAMWHEAIHKINPAWKEEKVEYIANSTFQVLWDNKLIK